jgi:hypothetical protein
VSHTYTPEELASLARKAGAKSIAATGPDAADDSVDITEIRQMLMRLSKDAHTQRQPISKALFYAPTTSNPVELRSAWSDAWRGLCGTEVYTFALAAVLRRAEQLDPGVAQQLAVIVEKALDTGLDWLEGANDDLPEPVVAEVTSR